MLAMQSVVLFASSFSMCINVLMYLFITEMLCLLLYGIGLFIVRSVGRFSSFLYNRMSFVHNTLFTSEASNC